VSELRADVVVVGSGVAGMSVALGLAATRDVLVVDDGDGSTRWAQGGIAVALSGDDPQAHAHDTALAGVGLGDPEAIRRLAEEAPHRVAELVARGAVLDRDADGALLRSREGGHDRPRVVHAGGDATGAEVWRALQAYADRTGLRRLRHTQVDGLVLAGGGVAGIAGAGPQGRVTVRANAVVLATGGVGHVYATTTNPVGVRGHGIALALRAGAAVTNMEFVQFHPTALATGDRSGQLPLVTEALRGAGAVLRDRDGTPFMAQVHPLADLAPRDVVAAAVLRAMRDDGSDHAWLDCRDVDDVGRRFPTVRAACDDIGVDLAHDLVPVRPAEHFLCGGIATDAWGATSLPGLYAVGEVADAGVHGANRLASNSLLEGLVYGGRVAAALTLELPAARPGPVRTVMTATDPALADAAQTLLETHAGIERTREGLDEAESWLSQRASRDSTCLVGAAIVGAARARTESVGCHRLAPSRTLAGAR
jgi:L-aspartate oxidase